MKTIGRIHGVERAPSLLSWLRIIEDDGAAILFQDLGQFIGHVIFPCVEHHAEVAVRSNSTPRSLSLPELRLSWINSTRVETIW